jgi:hypothetical protein
MFLPRVLRGVCTLTRWLPASADLQHLGIDTVSRCVSIAQDLTSEVDTDGEDIPWQAENLAIS